MHHEDVSDSRQVPRSAGGDRSAPLAIGTLVGAVDEAVEVVVDRLVESVEDCLAGLEALPAASVEERLEYVGLCAASAWGAPGLWVGAVDGDRLTTRRCRRLDLTASDAASGTPGAGACAPGADLEAHLGELATRAELLKALDGGSLLARPGDGSELGDRLPALGVAAAVAAGGYDHDARQWLVAVLMREAGADAAIARLALTSLVQAALVMPVVVKRH